MNLLFYLQTFILNYSFIVILKDHIFLLCFIKTQPFVKRKPVKTEKKIPERSRSVLGRFYCIIFYENPSSGSPVVSCGRTDGETDMTKQRVAFHNSSNAPNKN